ncbi:hypothetical protein LIS04_82 [Listeria phage LIS04]|nr:hypothetical protein LIS04_82 [Listeria phage LIS04]
MESVFSRVNGQSPVSQDFIWLGEYLDGTHLSEFSLDNGIENSFYSIDKSKLIRFGLIGQGLKMYFDMDGIFLIAGKAFEFEYHVGNSIYPLTGVSGQSRDIISYKDAEALFDSRGGALVSNSINQYNFGYKSEVTGPHGVNFNFKAICKVPYGSPVHISLRLVADKSLDGYLVVKKNNVITDKIKAPITAGVGGTVDILV